MTYYNLKVAAASNSYRPIILLEEASSAGALLEDAGLNVFCYGVLAPSYTPQSAKSDEPFMAMQTADGNTLDLTYSQITGYDIWGATTGLGSIHEIWDAIANNAPSVL